MHTPSKLVQALLAAAALPIVTLSALAADVSIADFGASGSPAEITGFFRAVSHVAKMAGVEESGYRILANAGPDSHQEVPHFHVHILGGAKLGPLLAPR